jgi:elongation factor 1 alpha-like protein
MFHSQQLSTPASLRKLLSVDDKKTGELIKKKPKFLTKNMSATVEIRFDCPVPVELYCTDKGLGRFTLRYNGCTISTGIITELR